MTNLTLPEPIAACFDADKRDGQAVASCFTPRAIVKDERRTHPRHAAIKAWKTAASARFASTREPLDVKHKDGRYIIGSQLTGDFPGSPVDLRFVFRLEHGKIASLEITA
jgi:hypothetical protein